MTIQKGDRAYTITELSREWKVERKLGDVMMVEYRIPKEAALDAAAVEQYIMQNEVF